MQGVEGKDLAGACARHSSSWLSVSSSSLYCVSGLIPSQGIRCWELPIPWWLMGTALLSLHMVIVSCLKWDLSRFSQRFLPCFLLIGAICNHYLKISELSSRFSFQLRLSRDSGIAEQMMLTRLCFPSTLTSCPMPLSVQL